VQLKGRLTFHVQAVDDQDQLIRELPVPISVVTAMKVQLFISLTQEMLKQVCDICLDDANPLGI
jgi:hypothetical protein